MILEFGTKHFLWGSRRDKAYKYAPTEENEMSIWVIPQKYGTQYFLFVTQIMLKIIINCTFEILFIGTKCQSLAMSAMSEILCLSV